MRYYLAVDIGASGGRHIIFWLEDGHIRMKELYRFENRPKSEDGKLLWDTQALFTEIINGMRECAKAGMTPEYMSIDTWGVDYVLLDEHDNVLGPVYSYRDHRTLDMDEEVYKVISEEALYARTGIQKAIFNTIYQLTADRIKRPEILKQAKTFLMLPDYFIYRLTGKKASEYTNATTTQLVDSVTRQWDAELIEKLGIPCDMFMPLTMPGERADVLSDDISAKVGYSCKVVRCASHDTASAVIAVPYHGDRELYLSSGTWSLMGVELFEARCDEASRANNFTNEGGYGGSFRYLKNIMGLWMIQCVRHEAGDKLSFAEYAAYAEAEARFPSTVDVNDERFLSPENMTEEIRSACRESGQAVPDSDGQLAAVIYKSLAGCYAETVRTIEETIGKSYDAINIIGGGCKNEYLDRITAEVSGKTVKAGPSEATAIGNALVQMMAAGDFSDISEARNCISRSFDIKVFKPQTEE